MKQTALYLATILSLHAGAQAQQLIIGDDYNVGNSSGFGAASGVNSGIATRLTGTAAVENLSYFRTVTTKAASAYSITSQKLTIGSAANSGRFVLSADGATSFDFAPALGAGAATASTPITYDVTMSMANNSAGIQRFSFALGTVEGDAFAWDFGLQLYRAVATDNFYTIQKRIDTGSTGLADMNSAITTTAPGTFGSEINFLLRVTDAGAESGADYNSRLQISLDGGSSFFYDTDADVSLVNGWRLDGAGRHFIWDAAGNAVATYDNFSVTVPEPSTYALAGLAGIAALWRRQRRSVKA